MSKQSRVVFIGQGDLFAGVESKALVPTVRKCSECGKVLKSHDGRASGIGTVCAAKIARQALREQAANEAAQAGA